MTEQPVRTPYFVDEIALIGIGLVYFLGAMQFTWISMNLELGLRGVFFMGIASAGLTMYGLSGRMNFTLLLLQWKRAILAVVFIGVGYVMTAILQSVILQFPLTVLDTIPADLRSTYLMEAALAETYFVFGMYSLFAGRLHPLAGMVAVGFTTPFLHLYVYGSSNAVLWAVAASFILQAVLLEYTRLFSVPLLIHLFVNLLSFLPATMLALLVVNVL